MKIIKLFIIVGKILTPEVDELIKTLSGDKFYHQKCGIILLFKIITFYPKTMNNTLCGFKNIRVLMP